MTGTAERMDAFIAETRALTTEAAFVARFPHPFLVREATDIVAPPEGERVDRTTIKVDRKAAAPVGDDFAREDLWILRLRPRDPGAGAAVTLGRDAACDVVVDDATVSLVHARFTVEADDDEDGDGRRFLVADAGSSNGTFVDGAPVRDRPAPVDDQASLRFGPRAKFQFFTASGFFQFLDFYRRIKKRGS